MPDKAGWSPGFWSDAHHTQVAWHYCAHKEADELVPAGRRREHERACRREAEAIVRRAASQRAREAAQRLREMHKRKRDTARAA